MRTATNLAISIFTLCFILVTPYELRAQSAKNGIFLTTKFAKNCQNRLKTFTKTKICLTPSPIVPITDFEEVTDMLMDPVTPDKAYFNLNLSESAYQRIKKLHAEMPGAEFALVVNNVVVGFISNLSSLRNRIIRIDGNSNSQEFKSIHSDLTVLLLKS